MEQEETVQRMRTKKTTDEKERQVKKYGKNRKSESIFLLNNLFL